MTELDELIAEAYKSGGQSQYVNKVYLTLLRETLFVPVKKLDASFNHIDEQEPFSPLFTKINNHFFMLAFDTLERLTYWAGDYLKEMDYVEISGKEIITGIQSDVYFGLNMGTEFYKEFSPDEIKKLKIIVAKINQMNTSS